MSHLQNQFQQKNLVMIVKTVLLGDISIRHKQNEVWKDAWYDVTISAFYGVWLPLSTFCNFKHKLRLVYRTEKRFTLS